MEPYHIKHQHQETANHSEHSFVHCYWLYTRHKNSRPARQNQCPTNGQPSQTPCYSSFINDKTQTHPLYYFNALDPPIN